MSTPSIDVCIASYRSPVGLRRLLLSLVRQETHGEFDYNVIVVDNDREGSAESVFRAVQPPGRIWRYAVEPRQSIAHARNRGIALASGSYVATIDDDEEASPDWLHHLHRTARRHRADVVHGYVRRRFATPPSAFVRHSRAFEVPNPVTGSREHYVMGTGNALFRRSVLAERRPPFDPALGRTGGSDSALFLALREAGRRLVWCREAVVFEYVSGERANWRWILGREFRIGNNFDRIRRRPPERAGVLLAELLSRSVRMAICAARAPFVRSDLSEGLEQLRRSARVVGRLAHGFGYRYEEYTASGPRLVREEPRPS